MLNSLRARLLASYVVIIIVCLVFVGTVMFFLLQGFRINSLKAGLAERAVPMAIQIRRLVLDEAPLREIEAILFEQTTAMDARAFLVDRQGAVLVDTRGDLAGESARIPIPASARLVAASAAALPRATGQFRLPSGELLVFGGAPVVPASRPDVRQVWIVLAAPLRGNASLVSDLSRRLITAGGVALLLSIVVAAFIARSIARPIHQVTRATEQVAKGNYDLHLDVQSPDEVRRLADSFNAMARDVASSRQAQRDFLANVSHELRTPLTSIRGFAQAILDGEADDRQSQHRAAEVVYQESERMIRMVEELLDLAKIEAGQIVMQEHTIDMQALVESAVRRFGPQAESQAVQLLLDLQETPSIQGDGDRLVQVISNLIDNALRYTPAGGQVTVSIRPEPAKTGEVAQVHVTVVDTGPGIPPADLLRLFERFYQVDRSRARRVGGTGLGLAIAKEIVEAHAGTIRVESIEGLGTRFIVELPVKS